MDWFDASFFDAKFFAVLFQVVLIDLTLAGDNAVVIGLAAAGLPKELRSRAIAVGIIAATVMRIFFALIAAQLLKIIGLTLVGGLLLVWVAWRMWREIAHAAPAGAETVGEGTAPKVKTLRQAIVQIIVADFSMSLDNVLGVAGAAREHPFVLVFGLALSVVLMGFAASFIARLLQRYHWLAYIGLVIILYVAGQMIWHGGREVLDHPAVMRQIELWIGRLVHRA